MVLSRAGQTWSFKSWQEQEYPEVADAASAIKVLPREQFVKKMLEEHEQAVQSYPTLHSYQTVMPVTAMTYPITAEPQTIYPDLEYRFDKTIGKVVGVRSGYKGQVRAQY